VWKLSAAKL